MQEVTLTECEQVDGGWWGEVALHAAIEVFCHAVDFSVDVKVSGPGFSIEAKVSC